MAVNKDPFVYSNRKDGKAHMFRGLVAAGVAIKRGEFCTWNETTGYFAPLDAVADFRYPIALAAEEQKTSGRHELIAARYIEFYSLDPEDIFEFELAAARALAVGDPFTFTASTTQKLTYAAGAFSVAHCVDDSHYPQEEDTTIRNQSYAKVSFNPAVSYWGFRFSKLGRSGGRKVIAMGSTADMLEGDMYNTLILISGTTDLSLPPVKPGMDVIFINTDAATQKINPDDNDTIRVDGAHLSAGNSITQTTQGYQCQLLTESVDGFVCISVPGQWTDGS
jgi:hypothetical protein